MDQPDFRFGTYEVLRFINSINRRLSPGLRIKALREFRSKHEFRPDAMVILTEAINAHSGRRKK